MLLTADGQGSVVALSRGNGRFRVPNLISGPYRFLALPGPRFAFAPVSVMLGDREVLGQVVELSSPVPALRVLYNANTGSGEAFDLRGVPPGDYYAFAFDHVDPITPPDRHC